MKEHIANRCRRIIRGAAGRVATLLDASRASWGSAPIRRLFPRSSFDPAAQGGTSFESGCLEPLGEGIETLKQVSGEIESCFLAVGDSLVKLPDFSEALVTHSERLLALASGRESGASTFESTMQLLEEPLRFIDRCQEELQELNIRLEAAMQQIDRLVSSEEHLNRAVAPLTYIRINFKIESAPLANSVQQMFLALTEDVERLHSQVSQTFQEKFTLLREARSTIEKVAGQLREDARNQGRVLREKRGDLSRALSELQADLKKNENRDIQLTHVSRAINQEVGKLVMLLQTQDIVSQRLAHVAGAILQIHQLHRPTDVAETGPITPSDLALCETSCRLQGAHLEDIEAEIKQADDGISAATRQINNQIVELDRECLNLSEFDKVTASVDGLVQVLLDTIHEVRSMAHNAVQTADLASRALQPIGGLASNLTGVMRELSAQIHLIALNAQIQAAHNSIGNGLEVLASRTANVSNEAGEISERVALGVDSLTVDLDGIVDSFAKLRAEGAQKRSLMEKEARSKEDELHAMRDETLRELMAVSDCVSQISTLASSMMKQNRLDSIVGERFDHLGASLSQVAAAANASIGQSGHTCERMQFSDELARNYTVASEHAVHKRIFGDSPVAGNSTLDVSLFDDESSPEPKHVETESVVDPVASSAELATAEPRVANGDLSEKKEAALGDNVDLF